MTSALGIAVSTSLLDQWREYFAPETQPFPADRAGADTLQLGRRLKPTMEHKDTFHIYGGDWIWLREAEFSELNLTARRRLLYGREAVGKVSQIPPRLRHRLESQLTDSRIVWWPSTLQIVGDQPLLQHVDEGLPPSRHREVRPSTWKRARQVLPGAADLAGRFPAGSGPNCFGNVMAAAGVPDADSVWMQREPFEAWLSQHTSKIRGTRRDGEPGVVLVWRDHAGQLAHAAVTIGDGYVINKPSQGWLSPRLVWTVQQTIAASRYAGVRLTRHIMSA